MNIPKKISLSAEIPEELKSELAAVKWGRLLSITPVVMTVVATLLAGLASSEMTRAQYDRALAAQLQSKAGDQWNFFQGKKMRSALQQNAIDMIGSTARVRPLDGAALQQAVAGTPAAAALASAAGGEALAVLETGALPKTGPAPAVDPGMQAALTAFDESRPESELAALLAKVNDRVLDGALRAAQARALAFDDLIKPLGGTIDLIGKQLGRTAADGALRRDFTVARLEYNERRYDGEARLNQTVASLYELQVRKSNVSAARHHRRSGEFFYGMLAAQLAVIVSTLAMVARKRNLLWTLAAAAGIVALAFALYVYLYV